MEYSWTIHGFPRRIRYMMTLFAKSWICFGERWDICWLFSCGRWESLRWLWGRRGYPMVSWTYLLYLFLDVCTNFRKNKISKMLRFIHQYRSNTWFFMHGFPSEILANSWILFSNLENSYYLFRELLNYAVTGKLSESLTQKFVETSSEILTKSLG